MSKMIAKKIAKVSELTREDWLQKRHGGLGGSEIGAACGISPYMSPLVLYMRKVGLYTQEIEDNDAMKAGRKLEPVLSEWFTEETGLKTYQSNFMFRHPEHEWALANIDRFIQEKEGKSGRGVLEIKTASEYVRDDWAREECPNHYLMQLQWYLFVTGLEWGAFAVLIGGNKFKYFFVDRDNDLIAYMLEIGKNFWFNHVIAQIPPQIDGSDSTTEMYKILNPLHSEGFPTLELPAIAMEWAENAQNAKREMDNWETAKKENENKIKDAMKEASEAYAGNHKITWKTDKRGVRPLKIKLDAVK